LIGSKPEEEAPAVEEKPKKEQIVLRYAHLAPAENTQGRAVQMMADLTFAKTNGDVKIDVFPASQLGSSEEQQEMLRLGTIDFNMASMDYWATLEPTWKIVGWAFAFESNEHLEKYSESQAYQEAIGRLEKDYNMKVLAINWIRGPYKVLLFKKPVKSIDDFQGVKHRLPEVESQLKNWAALGARVTPVAWPEVFLALKQGVVDSMDCPFDLVYDMKFHTVAPYVLHSKHMFQRLCIIVNAPNYYKLDKPYQDAIVEAAKEAGEWYSGQTFAAFEKNMKRLEDEGATHIFVDMSGWREKSMKAAWEMEAAGEWPQGTIQRVLLDTAP
jgi:tripartite ATP-independent transporter DctP family solute receptor